MEEGGRIRPPDLKQAPHAAPFRRSAGSETLDAAAVSVSNQCSG